MRLLYWILGILFILICISVGLYFYYFYVPPIPLTAATTLPPPPIPGPEDAWWNYEKMITLFPGAPKEKEFDKVMDFRNTPIPQDIPVLHRLIDQYKSCLDEFEQGADKTTLTIPESPLPQGQFTYALSTSYMTGSTMNMVNSFLPYQIMAKIMFMRGKLAELENQPEKAMNDYSILIKVGNQFDQGKLITRMIGYTIRSIGYRGFADFLSQPNSKNHSLVAFEKLKSFQPSPSPNMVGLENYEPGLRINDVVDMPRYAKIILGKMLKSNIELTKIRYQVTNAKQDLVFLSSALRLYQYKNQEMLDKLDKLVPDPLNSIPIDPFSNSPYIYQKLGNEVILYSFGPDTSDNKAQIIYDPTNGVVSSGDIVTRLAI